MEHNQFDSLLPPQMAERAAITGEGKAKKAAYKSFLLAISAGIQIGIAFVFYTVVTTGAHDMPYGVTKLLGGLAFSLGLILVVITGGELFTSSVLILVAKASGKISWKELVRNWTVVYFGNLCGSIILVFIMLATRQFMEDGGQLGLNAMAISQHKLHHTFLQAFALGLMCNILVCLAVWMTFSARSLTDKVMVLILPVAMFVSSGFEHCIANMFQVPMAIGIKYFAPESFWAMTGANIAQYADLNFVNFIVNNLIPVTLGNIVGGGVFVGMWYWLIYLKD
ncbi:TPA: formate transporter FocA [Vibrio cholerae]|uniref:Formate transporter FocA n=12 Tax=Gammaproteobacteria TaxID=1236 RepID=Q9KRE7_VIBCH|nr:MULTISPECIES: formate transporter FocA [Vibrio]3KLY_A Chain A, Putative formate transporter 1 [Vibrio cholerae]3KLY_B Chain B, Putative formate transporter 1 [Vibrio cholerae]3KLY_C Chain C, Putative formate transporter 1 [Vibrio cholerae]3KLY_D Chain D, Putative formate transporter 1 [Vibrio cholerae]3KLY_E Chain E, Putative formate transporter 1 [Vibrio cholerae]3KLZ_A Chain A, Putative formate transporter 1 [Vibrio cholerae]3KLZ_B Chain B, Putative formate transporter 1 [Vibrio cholera